MVVAAGTPSKAPIAAGTVLMQLRLGLPLAIMVPGLWPMPTPLPAAVPLVAANEPPQRAPEIRLEGKVITLPITMVGAFAFIEGEIAGVKGKLMLDTGMHDALVINDHRVSLQGGTRIGTGHFGSGQTYDVRLHTAVSNVRIGGLRYRCATKVRSQDARMLERITPDFLGWVGYAFFASYAMKLDYRRSRVTFYSEGSRTYLTGERLVATLPFETRKLPNVPLLRAKIGDDDAVVSLDTGMYGALNIPLRKRQLLFDAGYLKPSRSQDGFDLAGIRLSDTIDIVISTIEVDDGPSASAGAVGITEDTELELGSAFLKYYKTIWDYRSKRIYLLSR